MNPRNTGLLFSIAVILTTLWSLSDQENQATPQLLPTQDKIFPALTGQNLQEVTLNTGSFQTSIRKGVHGWHVTYLADGQRLVDDFADHDMVERLNDDLASLQSSIPGFTLRAKEAETWARYGLGSLAQARGMSIRVQYGNLARTLYLGLSVPNTGNLVLLYGRRDEEERVVMVDAKIVKWLQSVPNNPDFIRNRRPFQLEDQELPDKIFWYHRQERGVLEYSQDNIRLTHSRPDVTERGNREVWTRLLRLLREIRIHQFIYNDNKQPEEDAPGKRADDLIIVGYQTAEHEEYLGLGANDPKEPQYRQAHRIYFQGQEAKIAYSYLVAAQWADKIPTTLEALRDKTVAVFNPAHVRQISRTGSPTWSMANQKTGWQLTSPKAQPLKSERVQEFLHWLSTLQAQSFSTSPASSMAFSDGLLLELHEAEGHPHQLQLQWQPLTSPTPGVPDTRLVPITVAGEDVVRLISAQQLALLQKNYLDFYNNRVDAFVFADVTRLKITTAQASHDFYWDGQEWRQSPEAIPADRQKTEAILRHCAWIMAETVVGEGDEGRKQFGCHQAAYRLEITTRAAASATESARTIEIGNDVDDRSCAIWVSGFPYVYQITGDLKKTVAAVLMK